MKIYLLNEYRKILEQPIVYTFRLFFRTFGVILVSLWCYSSINSIVATGVVQIQWRADWIFEVAPVLWLSYLLIIILVGKFSKKADFC